MKRRLYRSNSEKMLAGVAGGLAEYFDVDPVLVRLAFVLLFFFNGVGLLLYIVAIFIIPKDESSYKNASEVHSTDNSADAVSGDGTTQNEVEKKGKSRMVFGVILVIIGSLLLLQDFFPSVDFGDIFPLVLVALGGWLLYPYLNIKKEVNA